MLRSFRLSVRDDRASRRHTGTETGVVKALSADGGALLHVLRAAIYKQSACQHRSTLDLSKLRPRVRLCVWDFVYAKESV